MTKSVVKFIHRMVYYACIVGVVFLMLMMLLTTSDVIGRSIFNRPVTGTFEITGYMLAIVVLLSLGYSQQTRQHVRVEFIVAKMPLRARLVINSLFTFFALIFFALVAWQGWEGGFNALHANIATDILGVPSYPFELLVAVGAFLLFVELLLTLITSVRNLKQGTADEELAS